MEKKTSVDAVAIQHEGGRRVLEATKGLSREEEAAYWQKAREAMLKRQAAGAKGDPRIAFETALADASPPAMKQIDAGDVVHRRRRDRSKR